MSSKKWYVISTFTGRENNVKKSIEQRKISFNLEENINQIIVAEREEPVLDKQGKPTGKTKLVNFYPGYVFVEMEMTDEAWFVIRNTPDVTGCVGSSGKGTKPFPVSSLEMAPILKKLNLLNDQLTTKFKVNDKVKIVSSSYEGLEGEICDISSSGEITVSVIIFGRPQQISFEQNELELINE